MNRLVAVPNDDVEDKDNDDDDDNNDDDDKLLLAVADDIDADVRIATWAGVKAWATLVV